MDAHPPSCCGYMLVLVGSILLNLGQPVVGQESQIGADKTIIEVELLTPVTGGSILAPQQWGQAFDKLGQSIRVRAPIAGDQPRVSEQIRGTLRFVKVVGVIDRNGRLLLGDRTYSLSDVSKIKAWLDNLKVYGAQGSPEGQPLWGLSREQFETVFGQLAAPVAKFSPTGRLATEIPQIPVPQSLPIRIDEAANEASRQETAVLLVPDVTGITSGTALAAVLSQRGLGFQPLRRPDGSIELVIQPLDDLDQPWPIGWDLPKEIPPVEACPTLYQIEPFVGLETQMLDAALRRMAAAVSLPVVIDFRRCSADGQDLPQIAVKYPYKQTAWGVVLRKVLNQNQLSYSLRHDEQGHAILYVHPFERVPARSE